MRKIDFRTFNYLARYHFFIESSLNSLKNQLRETYQFKVSDLIKGGIHKDILAEQLSIFGVEDYEHNLDLKGQLSLKISREKGQQESILLGFNQQTHKIDLVYIKPKTKHVSMIEMDENEIYSLNEIIKKILFL